MPWDMIFVGGAITVILIGEGCPWWLAIILIGSAGLLAWIQHE